MEGLIAHDDEQDADVDHEREQIRARRLERARALADDDPNALDRYLRERFASSYDDEEEEPSAPETTGIEQQSLLPTIRDPRLFIVKCRKPGRERQAVLSLLQKSFNMRRRGHEIGIFSAVAPDHLRGKIYVEALGAAQVIAAINGLDLFASYDGVKPVPLDEMTDVLKPGKKANKQAEGKWVRMGRGMYKGDLAQVCGVQEGEDKIMVRLIPRLDLKSEKDYMEDFDQEDYEQENDKSGTKRKGRPPQRLFDKRDLFRLTGSSDVYTQRDKHTGVVYDVWNDDLYRYGLLYKKVSPKTLVIGDAVQPQLEELEKWLVAESRMKTSISEDPTSVEAAEAARGLGLDIDSIAGRKGTKLFKGDSIRVAGGEQKGLSGTIASISGDVIRLKVADLPEPLVVFRNDVRKTFNVGDNVKVTSGKRVGCAGVIVRVENDVLTIFTDSTREEIRVLSSQVADSADLNSDVVSKSVSAVQSKMQYELFDLVRLLSDSNEYGVVTQVRNDGVGILTTQNIVRIVPVGAIRGKMRDAFVRATDARGNPIAPNDTIHVIQGPQKDRQGVVKHVAGTIVFFKARDELNNCGIVAVAASDCTASTAAARRLTSTLRQPGQRTSNMPAPIPRGSMASLGRASGFGGGRGGHMGSQRDELWRKEVKIRKGQYKGHLGKVVDVTDAKVRVELKTKMKTITINREMVKPTDGSVVRQRSDSTGSFSRPGPRAPRAPSIDTGSRTPGFNSRTPRNDDRYSRTPRVNGYGSQTPRYATATPRAGPNTPGRFGTTPGREEFGRTPMRSEGYGNDYRTPVPSTPTVGLRNPYAPFAPATPSTPAPPQTPLGSAYPAMEPRTPAVLEPTTPGYGLEPATPAPGLEPATPAPGMEPTTPAPVGMEPRTPAVGHEPRTPAPGAEPSTPMVQEPATPMTPGIPQTPRPAEEESSELGFKVLMDVEVLVNSENGFQGVVVSASANGGDIKVRMLDGDKKGMVLPVTDITPIQPRPDGADNRELVKVLAGSYIGRVGRLTSVRTLADKTLEGHIRFLNGEEAKIQLNLVAKCSQST